MARVPKITVARETLLKSLIPKIVPTVTILYKNIDMNFFYAPKYIFNTI